jgi:hypothetical protein
MKSTTIVLVIISIILLSGCQSIPKDALKLSPETLEKRNLQTRKYEGILESDLLLASAGVIQDLGFNIDESETKLGVISGSKRSDATDAGQIAGAVLLALATGVVVPVDSNQKFNISLVVRPSDTNPLKNHFVRVTFQRIVWNTNNNISTIEGLEDPEMYQDFFTRLSKAVFLEGHKL